MLCEGVMVAWRRRLSGGMCLQIVWDAERKRWINTDQTEEEMDKPAAPPPKDSELSGETGGWVLDGRTDVWMEGQVFGWKDMFGWKDRCLDGRTDVWMEGQMCVWKDRCLDGKTDVWMEGQMFGWKDRCLDGRTDVWMEGLMFGWKDRCLDGRTDVWMEGQVFGWKD